jgi:hypothetical protein
MYACQGVAAMGIIERVEMLDFMCHAYLKFNFGPQINFIIGECSAPTVCRSAEHGFQISQVTMAVSGQSHNQHSLPDISRPGGKSAVLTAITVALGGKASVTGRGSGLKSFIKEGKP